MSQAKRKLKPGEVEVVAVRMRCTLSGDGWSVGAGEVALVEPDEADRLVALGVADLVDG